MSTELKSHARGVDLTRFAGKNETCVQVTMKRDFEKEGERSSSDNFFDNIKLTRSQAAALAADLQDFAQGRERED
tara:strand:- start:3384 stop:3608 length:225 start_codon:yes stop_codon:yes gene_type:complete